MVVPASWRRSIHPRRGGIRVDYVPVSGEVPDWPGTRAVLEDLATAPDVAAAGLAVLDGSAPSPLGAAAVGAILLCASDVPPFERLAVADGWIARHGLPFAAAAAAELSELVLTRRSCPVRRGEPVPAGECGEHSCEGHLSLRRASDRWEDQGQRVPDAAVLARVRVAVAAAPADVHAAVLEALAPHREGSLRRRIATSFLDPTQTAWVDADAEELARQRKEHTDGPLLMAAAHTAAQAALIRPWLEDYGGWWPLADPTMMHTIAEGLGDGILDVYDRWRERGFGTVTHARSVGMTASVASIERDWAALPQPRCRQWS